MKIYITLEVDDEIADPDDETGVTSEAFDRLFDALMHFGTEIDINRMDES